MSVICQNFVQNAWKKDLCSNCFKSVGDHSDSGGSPISNQNHLRSDDDEDNGSQPLTMGQNGRYISQATTIYQSRGSTPHTTWKSLISEKNEHNAQPFKLENGFRGRLLTINTGNNILEKKSFRNVSFLSASLNNSAHVNGKNASKPVQNGFGHSPNGHVNGIHNGDSEKDCIEVNSICEAKKKTSNGVLQGILKKSNTPSPAGHQRRSSVGFKEEEPMVIGYGGRDFSPEDLEWEMASDGGTSDSLDETEEDKAISKITKENTEFNSDTTNLLQEAKDTNGTDTHGKADTKDRQQEQDSAGTIVGGGSSGEGKVTQTEEGNKRSVAIEAASTVDAAAKDKNIAPCNNGTCTGVCGCKSSGGNSNDSSLHSEPPQQSQESGVAAHGTAPKPKRDSPPRAAVKPFFREVPWSSKNNGNVISKEDENREKPHQVIPSSVVKPGADEKDDTDDSEQTNSSSHSSLTSLDSGDPDTPIASIVDGVSTSRDSSKSAPPSLENQKEEVKDGVTSQAPLSSTGSSSMTAVAKSGSSDAITDAVSPGQYRDASSAAMSMNQVSDYGPPRVSFLHGAGVEYKESVTTPSAVYSPGGDLFVSRSNSSSSSSSSSSDELKKGQEADVDGAGEDVNSPPIAVDPEEKNILSPSAKELSDQASEKREAKSDVENDSNISQPSQAPFSPPAKSEVSKVKPKVPAKPTKPPPSISTSRPPDIGHYAIPCSFKQDKSSPAPTALHHGTDNPADVVDDDDSNSTVYYSVANGAADAPKIGTVNHYAESNIYQEINGRMMRTTAPQEQGSNRGGIPGGGRETKLAALAMELEQARYPNGNTKRQAPAPPKVPEPPSEEPPSSCGRTPSPSDFQASIMRSDSIPFSSASSTTSSSSQDTETGFTASWNLHGDIDRDEPVKCLQSSHLSTPKSKSSFLLTQYSKCKMLAIGSAEDGAKSKKKFSLKKLLKIGKESDVPVTFDPNAPNPKAWKYNDHFERPRAKLEIIHPMDLENKTVTVNPGFDPLRSTTPVLTSGSTATNSDTMSIRTSTSSDYSTFCLDTTLEDSKEEGTYDNVTPLGSQYGGSELDYYRGSITSGQMVSGRQTPCSGQPSSSASPTPSRCSQTSQASTLTSGSSRNGAPARPPKPPPPPRAHSLLPGNKNFNSAVGPFKYPDTIYGSSIVSDEAEPLSTKPQAPKRQYRSGPKSEYANSGDTRSAASPQRTERELTPPQMTSQPDDATSEAPANDDDTYESIGTIIAEVDDDSDDQQYQDVALPPEDSTYYEPEEEPAQSPKDSPQTESVTNNEIQKENNGETPVKNEQEKQDAESSVKVINPIYSTSCQKEGIYQALSSKYRSSPLTKAPSRPPPIYVKPPNSAISRDKPWKCLETSYTALATTNHEVLVKLIDQGIKRRPSQIEKYEKIALQWTDFELDTSRPAVAFAFGDKVVYDASFSYEKECLVTLVVTIQQHSSSLSSNSQFKYPVLGHFNDNIPSQLVLVDGQDNNLPDTVQASVCVLHRAEVTTIENFIEGLPEECTEQIEREMSFILLQLIQGLKNLQAQGIETVDASFQGLLLAKTGTDKLYTLIFLSDHFVEEMGNVYSSVSDNCKISLCQYALMLALQLLQTESEEELVSCSSKFTKESTCKIFTNVVNILAQEKASSLSQVKTLLESFLWGVQHIVQHSNFENRDSDAILHRWLDIERSQCIKAMINNNSLHISTLDEFHSQFLVRTNVRCIKEVAGYL